MHIYDILIYTFQKKMVGIKINRGKYIRGGQTAFMRRIRLASYCKIQNIYIKNVLRYYIIFVLHSTHFITFDILSYLR